MPVEFWTGGEFDYSHERKAQDQVVRDFRARFERAVDPVIVVFNLFCNGKPLDLLFDHKIWHIANGVKRFRPGIFEQCG